MNDNEALKLVGDRALYYAHPLASSYDKDKDEKRVEVVRIEDANLVSSKSCTQRQKPDTHQPVIDIDLPCSLVPSSTDGHYHLYIDKDLSWKQYEKLLKVMADVGIVEEGYYEMAKARKESMVRLPNITKPVPLPAY